MLASGESAGSSSPPLQDDGKLFGDADLGIHHLKGVREMDKTEY